MGVFPDSALVAGALALVVLLRQSLQQIIRATFCLPAHLILAIKRIDWTSPLGQSKNCGEIQFAQALLIRAGYGPQSIPNLAALQLHIIPA